METIQNTKTLLAAGAALSPARSIATDKGVSSAPYVLVPDGYKVESLERLLPAPMQTRANVALQDADSFCLYWRQFKRPESVLFADPNKRTLCAVFDYHTSEEPSWCKHTATLHCELSQEWIEWSKHSGNRKTQIEFAQFIESNLVDIVKPDSAKVLEASRSLQAKKNLRFSSSVRLEDGERQFSFEEETKGTTAKGSMRFPETLTLGIPVFLGGPMYEVLARLRYRITEENGLILWYDLHRPSHIVDDAFSVLRKDVEKRLSVAALSGSYHSRD